MNTTTAEKNDQRGRLIVAALLQNGVKSFLVAPGSRSTPLVLAVAEHPGVETIVHFDERGIAYHGLGMAKVKRAAVAIICTSGTAVANLYPALVEASLDHIPLLFLCADRPFELRECGANQTIDQVKMFGSYLRFECDLPAPDDFVPDTAITTLVDQACYRARTHNPGPVLLNCMFREPLSSYPEIPAPFMPPLHTRYYPCVKTIPAEEMHVLAEQLSTEEKGVIVAGTLPYTPALSSILTLAEKLQWPVLAGPLSHLRSFGANPFLLTSYNHLLPHVPPPEVVLHFGGQILSKTVHSWIQTAPIKQYIQVADFPNRHDPYHEVTDRIEMAAELFATALPVRQRERSGYLTEYQETSALAEKIVQEEFALSPALNEPLAVFSLLEVDFTETLFFFANSLAIRYADSFFFPKRGCGAIYGNRGVSGIDGNIATIAGIARESKKPVVAIVGDFAFLHDLNSLALLCNPELRVTLIVLNNQGGGIFSSLPVASSPHLERFFTSTHNFAMQPFAAAFGIPYLSFTDREEYVAFLRQQKGTHIVEVASSVEQNLHYGQSLKEKALREILRAKSLVMVR